MKGSKFASKIVGPAVPGRNECAHDAANPYGSL